MRSCRANVFENLIEGSTPPPSSRIWLFKFFSYYWPIPGQWKYFVPLENTRKPLSYGVLRGYKMWTLARYGLRNFKSKKQSFPRCSSINFAIFPWKQLLNLFLVKLQAWGDRCFSKKSAKFLRTTVLQDTSSGCFWNQWNILNLFIIVSVILSGYIYKLKFTRKVFKTDQVFKSFFLKKNLS